MTRDLTNSELAILGLVAERPKHGYQIEQDIEQRGMRAWAEIGFSSIYYALNKLEAAGWLTSQLHAEGAGPARRVYQLTEGGQGAYRQAVRRRLAQPRPRSGDFDLALANLPALPPAEARQALLEYRDSLRDELRQVGSKWAADVQAASTVPDAAAPPGDAGGLPPHVHALFDHALALMRAELAWLEDFLTQNE